MRHDDIEHTLDHIRGLLLKGRRLWAGPRKYGFEVCPMPKRSQAKIHLKRDGQPLCRTNAKAPRYTTSPSQVTCEKCRRLEGLDA